MDGQDYLNQISASVRPEKKQGFTGILSSKFFIFGVVSLIILIGTIIIGSILGGAKGDEKDSLARLKLNMETVYNIVGDNQRTIKSSVLRSSNATLLSILSNSNRDINNYLEEKYAVKDDDIDKNIIEEDKLNKEGIEADLFNARINGNLDRVFAVKITYEISSIMNQEGKIYNSTKSDELKQIISNSYSSLENLYNDFSSFSETK